MTQVVLLHSALGLTQHVLDWAEALREDGHTVVTPDLFGGEVFGDLDAGVEKVDGEGFASFVAVARGQVAGLDGPRVYAGFSLGGGVAEVLALQDPQAVGLVVVTGAVSPAWFDITAWPAGLAAQLHAANGDPWLEPDENAALVALADGACEEFEYSTDGHLFAFEGWHEYDEDASHLLFERVSDFLAALDK
ncbi:MAG: dienelactone hydrolase [Actinobacteria bacterium HGW-Actinobacteria-4]|nr:MAG: dienelactone hydrolase [Actinobacteria bacterium HGW-Actinobacteria-4]